MPNYKNIKLGERMDSYYDYTWQKSPDGKVILDANSGCQQELMLQAISDISIRTGLSASTTPSNIKVL
jgi:hypothetical protein